MTQKFFIRETTLARYKYDYKIIPCEFLEEEDSKKKYNKDYKVWIKYGICGIKSFVSRYRIFDTYEEAEQNLEKVKELIYKERNPTEFDLKK